MKSPAWNIKDSIELYGMDVWGADYFAINSKGNMEILPKGDGGPKLDLHQVVDDLVKQNIRLPALIRFPDIISSQMKKLITCFNKSIKEYGYNGKYQGVFPIKVNQQNHVIRDILKYGRTFGFGLEVGSKPELLIALALIKDPGRLIICNGFKDKEYIQTGLLAKKAGLGVIIVVDRFEELNMILKIAKDLNIKAPIGFRIKLSTQGNGKWMDSSGFKSKFGLTANEIVAGIDKLKEENILDCLKLLHFHIGSQVSSIHPIKSAIREASRVLTETHKLGAKIKYLDVGGGLGIDYDGTGKTHSSTNYSEQEYANDIVYNIQSICDENQVPHPHIISESGRFLVAHSSLLIFNIMSANMVEKEQTPDFKVKNTHVFVTDLFDIYKGLEKNSITESFNDLIEKRKDINQLFIYGVLSLKEAALSEQIFCATASKLKTMVAGCEDYEEIYEYLSNELADIYFSNFSVFQSLPDSWALGHLFPVIPIHRLKEKPTRRASLADLTCDSDGKIAHFMNYHLGKREKHLPVHKLNPPEPYYMAVCLTGAYQEILGDMHNLFGDTDAVHISLRKNGGFSVEHHVEGDCIYDMLKYVGYHKRELMEMIHQSTEKAVLDGKLSRQEAGLFLKNYNQGLSDYTYLSPSPLDTRQKLKP